MNDAEMMGLSQCCKNLAQHIHDASEGQRPLFVHNAGQVATPQKFHDQVELIAILAEVDNANRIGMIETTRRTCFGNESDGGVFIASQMRMDDLDRHSAVERLLLSAIDPPHPANA